jgi:anti-sigma factor RsiW
MKSHDGARCRELLERLSRYIDGELEGRERRSLMAHLRQCPCCEEFAESLRRTVLLCQQAGRRRLPAEVRARARARIAELMAESTRG